jgi:hypothetical protein
MLMSYVKLCLTTESWQGRIGMQHSTEPLTETEEAP